MRVGGEVNVLGLGGRGEGVRVEVGEGRDEGVRVG